MGQTTNTFFLFRYLSPLGRQIFGLAAVLESTKEQQLGPGTLSNRLLEKFYPPLDMLTSLWCSKRLLFDTNIVVFTLGIERVDAQFRRTVFFSEIQLANDQRLQRLPL